MDKNKDVIVFPDSDATTTASGHLPYPLQLVRTETGSSSNYGSQPHNLSSQDLPISGFQGFETSMLDTSSLGLFISNETLVQINKGDKSYIVSSRELNQANLESILGAGWSLTGYQGADEVIISRLIDITDLGVQLVFALAEEEPAYHQPKKDRDDDHEDGAGGGNMQHRCYLNPIRPGIRCETVESSQSQSTNYNNGENSLLALLPLLIIGSLCFLPYPPINTMYEELKSLAGAVTNELLTDYII